MVVKCEEKTIKLNVNGKSYSVTVKATDLLLDVLRDKLLLHGTKKGCENGECGACTVLVNNEPVNSCIYLAIRADGKEIMTIEGMSKDEHLSILQKAFIHEGALQCGFCGPGMLISAKALLDINSEPSEKEIREALAGNLCRCSGYVKIVNAVDRAAKEQCCGKGGE